MTDSSRGACGILMGDGLIMDNSCHSESVSPGNLKGLRVVLCHDWLVAMRGGERVLEALCGAFPDAPIYTLICDRSAISDAIKSHDIRSSWLQGFPCATRCFRYLLPLFPFVVERMRFPDADLVISTSHCVAKGLRPGRGARHLCYCFTPMRYAWALPAEYFRGAPVRAMAARPVMRALRSWDRRSSKRVDRFVAISRNVQSRINRYYGRDSDVVCPPVDTSFFTPAAAEKGVGDGDGGYDLVVSALVPYKRVDLAVAAYSRMGTRLKIAGAGSEYAGLRRAAGPRIEFLGWVPDEQLLELYRGCRMLIFPGEEDFGIVPVEAQACGRPVVAYGKGGALETVRDGITGVFFREQTPDSLIEAVGRCDAKSWDRGAARSNAERFGAGLFLEGIRDSIRKCLSGF